MSLNKQLVFDTDIGQAKPITILHNEGCPFCNRHELQGILAEEGPIIFLVNKYPVLKDTMQTVIIETDDCNSELSLYSKDHLYKLLRFSMAKWQEMRDSGQFKSVLFYKNHGPYSGGTIRHPHMQIVGLKEVDYAENIKVDSFDGCVIDTAAGVELNISKRPRIGLFEFNIKIDDLAEIDRMADYLQLMAHYLLNNFHKSCNSYNIFFYYLQEQTFAKIMPRFVTSPLFVGYGIPQVSSRIQEVRREIREKYLNRA
jgi:ATP adenylyltransferase/5',5'''-P-1,P-4-tetraphosphate phosphorylase II